MAGVRFRRRSHRSLGCRAASRCNPTNPRPSPTKPHDFSTHQETLTIDTDSDLALLAPGEKIKATVLSPTALTGKAALARTAKSRASVARATMMKVALAQAEAAAAAASEDNEEEESEEEVLEASGEEEAEEDEESEEEEEDS